MDVRPWRHRVNGPVLRAVREKKRWQAKAFCAKAQISRNHLNEVEQGRRQPSRMWVYHVAEVLGVDFTTFCDPVDDDEADAA